MNKKNKIMKILGFIVIGLTIFFLFTYIIRPMLVAYGFIISSDFKNSQNKNMALEKETTVKKQDKELVHIAFAQKISEKRHGFYDGEDLGEISSPGVYISGENVAFTRKVDGIDHVIYNGNDLGEGREVRINGNNITYIRDVGGKPHIIHNNEDFGEILIIDKGYGDLYQVSGDNVGFFREVNGKTHVIYNKQDMGRGIHDSLVLGENSYAFLKSVDYDPQTTMHIIYNGKDLRGAQDIYFVSDKYVFYQDIYKTFLGGHVQMYFRNMEKLGRGQYITVDNDGNYLLTGRYVTSNYIYNGKNVGKSIHAANRSVDSGNYVFVREVDGKRHVIYNGEDLGEGDAPVIGGNNIAYIKVVGDKKHIIYNDNDLGEGSQVFLSHSGEDLMVKKEIDGVLNLFHEGKNLGVCDKDCYPGFSNSNYY